MSSHAQGVLVPYLSEQFFNTLAQAAVNYKLCTYQAGTTTLLATYSNVTLTTQNANPVQMSTGGLPLSTIYVNPATPYKYVLMTAGTDNTCSTGTVIWTRDNVTVNGINGASLSCSGFAGASASIQIANCANALPAAGGTADARGLNGAQNWTTDAFSGITKPIDFQCGATTYTIATTATIPSNVHLIADQGCIFSVNSGITLTLNGSMEGSSRQQHFTGNGVVKGTGINLVVCRLQADGGAKGDAATDDTAAWTTCANIISNFGTAAGKIIVEPGQYCSPGVDLATNFTAVHLTIEFQGRAYLRGDCSGLLQTSKPLLSLGGTLETEVHGGFFAGYNSPLGTAPVISFNCAVSYWTCEIDDAIITSGRGGIQSFGQLTVNHTRIVSSYGDYIAQYGANLYVYNSQLDSNGIPVGGCTATPRSITTTLAWSQSKSVASCQIVQVGAQNATITNAVWTNTNGGQTTFTVSSDLTPYITAGQVVYASRVVATGGSGRGFNGYFVVVSINATTIVVTQVATSSPGTYSSGGTAAAQSWFLMNNGGACTTSNSGNGPSAATFGTVINGDGSCSWQLLGVADAGGHAIHIYGSPSNNGHYVKDTDMTGYSDSNVLIEGGPSNIHFIDNTPANAVNNAYLIQSGQSITISDKQISNCLLSSCVGINIGAAVTGDIQITNNVIVQTGIGVLINNGPSGVLIANNNISGNTYGVEPNVSASKFQVNNNTFGGGNWGNNVTADILLNTGNANYSMQGNICYGPGLTNPGASVGAGQFAGLNPGCIAGVPNGGVTVTVNGGAATTFANNGGNGSLIVNGTSTDFSSGILNSLGTIAVESAATNAKVLAFNASGGDGKSQIVVTHSTGGTTQPLETFSDSTLITTHTVVSGTPQFLVGANSTDFSPGNIPFIVVSADPVLASASATTNATILDMTAVGGDGNSQLVATHSGGAGVTKPFEIFSDSTKLATFQPGAALKIAGTGQTLGTTVGTVSQLPGSPTEGDCKAVSDSMTATYNATVTGSGTNHIIACWNGTNWVAH